MKLLLTLIICLSINCSTNKLITPPQPTPVKTTTITYTKSFDAEVLQSTKPVLVEFSAKWCDACKIVEPIVDELAIDMQKSIKIVKIDVEDDPVIAYLLNITLVPTLILFNKGKIVRTLVGVTNKDQLKQFVDME